MGVRVAVVGTCGSGKTTIVSALREQGYDAYVVGQEHSVIKDLWRHLNPDAVVALTPHYRTIQARRGASWPRWLFDLQTERLADARDHATIQIDTGEVSVEETIEQIRSAIPNDGDDQKGVSSG